MTTRTFTKSIAIICVCIIFNNLTSSLFAQNKDYGDLPSSFGVASHSVSSGLFMGDMVDYESAFSSLGEDAIVDDNDDSDDEDALLTITTLPIGAILIDIAEDNVIFRLNIPCTNTTGVSATLGAWIDFDGDGEFQDSEYAYATVYNGYVKKDIELQWGSTSNQFGLTHVGDDYIGLRLRLSSSISSNDYNDDANGAQSNGEVEDYLLPVSCACGKGVTNYWYFDKGRGIDFNTLTTDVETGYTLPSSVAGGQTTTNEGTSSMSNACGKRLIYSDGTAVWNANHEIIPGMTNLAPTNGSSNYHPTQSGVVLSVPFRNDLFYLFITPPNGNRGPVEYSVIDLTKEKGLGGVAEGQVDHANNLIEHPPVSGNDELLSIPVTHNNAATQYSGGKHNMLELLTAIETADRDGYWVFCHGASSNISDWSETFFIGKLTVDGISWREQSTYVNASGNTVPFLFDGGTVGNGVSYMKFSPQGNHFVVGYSTNLYYYNFNTRTGVISKETLLLGAPTNEGGVATPVIAIPSKDLTGSAVSASNKAPFSAVDWITSSSEPEFYSYIPTSVAYSGSYDSNLSTKSGDANYLYGMEFSVSGNMVYVSSYGKGGTNGSHDENGIVYQLGNLNSSDFDADPPRLEAVFMIDNILANTTPAVTSGSQNEFKYCIAGLQLGKDEKIYFVDPGSRYLGVIHKPEKAGPTCDIEPYAINITNGDEGSGGNRALLALPNFSASNFFKPTISSAVDTASVGATVDLKVYSEDTYTSVRVDFGDGSSLVDILTVETADLVNFPLGYRIEVDYNGSEPVGATTVFSAWPVGLTHEYTRAGEFSISLYYQQGRCDYRFTDIQITVDADVILETEYVDKISDNSATLHASITDKPNYDEEIVEFGFLYSHVQVTENALIHNTAGVSSVIVSTFSAPQDVSSMTNFSGGEVLYSTNLTNLNPRQYAYYRAYVIINPSGGSGMEYIYGDVKRFITERRDFSLKTGGGFVVVDQENTRNGVSNWDGGLDFSFDLWVRRTRKDTEEVILSNKLVGYKLLFNSDNKVVFDYTLTTISNAIVSDDTIANNEWHHIAVTCNNTSTLIYLDGEALTTTGAIPGYTAPIDQDLGYLYIGAEGVSEVSTGVGQIDYPFLGYIDALRFWCTKLTDDQVKAILYDNILAVGPEGSSSSLALAATQDLPFAGLDLGHLTAAFGFNVESRLAAPVTDIEYPFLFKTQDFNMDYNFFHEDSRLKDEIDADDVKFGYNALSIGDVAPSVVIPRVNWRNDTNSESWFNSSNWSGFAYPGQGITSSEAITTYFNDINEANGINEVSSDIEYCEYTVINKVQTGNSKPIITVGEKAEIQSLIDKDADLKSYRVDEAPDSKLIIHDRVQSEIGPTKVVVQNGTVIIDQGSIEIE